MSSIKKLPTLLVSMNVAAPPLLTYHDFSLFPQPTCAITGYDHRIPHINSFFIVQ